MAVKRRRPECPVWRSGLVILFLLCVKGVFSQEYSPLEVQIEKTSVTLNERIKYTVIVDHDEYNDITVTEPENMGDLPIYSGPSKRKIIETGADGRTKSVKASFSYTFRPRETGRKVIPPFVFSFGGRSYSTEAFMVEIGLIKDRKLYIPYEAYWSPAFTEAYVGEAIPVVLYVRNEPQISLFPKVRTTAPNGGFWEEAAGLGQIEQEELAGNIVYTIPVSGYIFTPSRDGRLVIQAAEIETDVSDGKANSEIITVRPIPEEISTTGAIGNLVYSFSLDTTETALGEEVVLSVQVSGTGNLNYLQIPEPAFSNLEFLESKRVEDIHAYAGGYSGTRTEEFVFQPVQEGRALITVHPFPFLDREEGEVMVFPGADLFVMVKPRLIQEEDESSKLDLIPMDNLEAFERRELYNDPLNYVLLLPGIIALITAFVIRHKKRAILYFFVLFFTAAGPGSEGQNNGDRISWEMYYNKAYYEAGREFYRQAVGQKTNPALYYNSALSFYRAGETGKAVTILRKAVFLDPGEERYRLFSGIMEDGKTLPFQEPEIIPLHPDLFFIIFLIAWNLSCAAYTVSVFRKGSILVIVLIFLTICTVGSVSGIAATCISRTKAIGIIRYDSTKVRKIPRENSGASYLLNSGQTLSLEGFSDPYYLIETKNGITGWLNKNDIYTDSQVINELLADGEENE
ncbi:MAG: BatD family protein [Spirochaetales bacterium]|nr:BatD family protein [Spirochaetales bacterium]